MTYRTTFPESFPRKHTEVLTRLLRDAEVTTISATWWREGADWRVERRRLNDTLLLAPLRGSVRAEVGGEGIDVDAAEVLMVPEGVDHALAPGPGCHRLEQIAVHMHVTGAWQRPLMPLFASPVQRLDDAAHWHGRLRRLVVLMNEAAVGQPYGAMLVKELLAGWVLAGAAVRKPPEDSDPRILRALERMHREYARDLTVRELAAAAGLSTVQFRKLFRRHVHQSPKQYMIGHRLKLAAEHLRNSLQTAQEIAFASGFNSEAYFHRCFRRFYHCTPLEYRAGGRDSV